MQRNSVLVVAMCCGLALAASFAAAEPPAEYKSPYKIRYSHPVKELIHDLEETERGNHREQSEVPFREWYSEGVRERWGAWGPPAKHYPAPEGVANKSVEWRRERVIAVAMRYRGYEYQHHHIPDWNPPANWPWLKVQARRNGKGMDCSNFTAFVYNQGFGIKPSGAIREQAEQTKILGPGRREIRAERIELPEGYKEVARTLKTGDLLYIRGKPEGEITHVVIWVGRIGESPNEMPLVLDSHGEGVKDADGVDIPAGIHLRPFGEHSWYRKCASHAHRIIREE